MPQINLLKQTHSTTNYADKLPGILVKVFGLILLLVVGYYVSLIMRVSSLSKRADELNRQIATMQQHIAEFTRKPELVTRQGQLKELNALIQNHIYWNSFLPELARVTLVTASYNGLDALSDGTMTLSSSVPTYAELDKYLQVFDRPEFNANFSDLKISGVNQMQDGDSASIAFRLSMKFNTAMLKYNFGQNNK